MLMAVCHSSQTGWTEVEELERLSDLRAQAGNVLWAEADVASLTPEDIETIAEEFGLHPLAVEDAINTRQRPKVESYEGHLFIVFHQLDEVDGQLEACQIACFIGDRYVLALHDHADRLLENAKKRFSEEGARLDSPAFLVYTMLDVVVDDYQEKADSLELETEELEELVLASPTAPIQRQLYSTKQRIARLRRYVMPGSRLLEWLLAPSHSLFSEDSSERFRDIHDHLLRMVDQIRNIDELTDAILNLVRSEQANALNDVNKRLAAWAAIFGVGTFIAGVYGMNFTLVPRDQTLFGFWFAIALMALSSGGLYAYFKRRGWL
ncbi:MAG TPA: magnesium transporter CorA family protein [Actinomycetota bacterium]|nr:magnesium transporter CorA family protein [Actinomycetota bacterium]